MIAATGRPGPVLIDLPKDIAQARIKFKYPKTVELTGYKPTYRGTPRWSAGRRAHYEFGEPVIYAGGGPDFQRSSELLQLAETISAPVTHTLMGLGCFRQSPSFWGCWVCTVRGTPIRRLRVRLLIAVGPFDDRW